MIQATPKTGLRPSTSLRKSVSRGFAIRIGRASQALATILIGLAGISAASAQSLYSVADLGVLPGYEACYPSGLNDRGDVVGGCDNASIGEAFVWRNGSMSVVGKSPGGNYSFATAINSLGIIAGDGDPGNFLPQAWVTTANGLINIFPEQQQQR